jgi:hypothetical protein
MSSIATWLPYPDFQESAAHLHKDDLAIQRWNILELAEWYHKVDPDRSPIADNQRHNLDDHPITEMWEGHVLQLVTFGLVCCDVYSQIKGDRDPLVEQFMYHMDCANTEEADMTKPSWFGDVEVHLSHRAELLRMRPKYYSAYFMPDQVRHMVWPKSSYAL